MDASPPLQPIIPRNHTGLIAIFVFIAVLGGVAISRTPEPSLSRSEAKQATPAPLAWVPFLVRGEPQFYSISAQEVLAGEYLPPPPEPQVHVAMVGEAYRDLAMFHADVTSFAQFLATQSPLNRELTRLVFHYLDHPQEFGCQVDAHIFSCDYQRVLETLDAAGVPADYAVVVRLLSQPGLSPAGARVYDIHESKERAFYEKLP